MRIKALLTIILLSLLSCYKTELDFDNKNFEPIPIVNCLFTEDSTFKVWVGRTKNIFTEDTNTIEVLKVFITSEDGKEIKLNKKDSHLFVSDSTAKAGIVYNLKVETEKYGTLSATSSIPFQIAPIDSVFIIKKTPATIFSNYGILVRLIFSDIANNTNCYEISCLGNKYIRLDTPVTELFKLDINSCLSPIFQKEGIKSTNNLIFSDKSYENQTIAVDFYITQDFLTKYKKNVFFYLKNISKDYFSYLKSIDYCNTNNSNYLYIPEIEDLVSFNFLSKPSSIYTNIKGGTGIFAGYNCKSKYILNITDSLIQNFQ